MPTAPTIIAGGGTWGHNVDGDGVRAHLAAMQSIGVKEIDTAALYPFSKPTTSEKIIGKCRFGQEGYLIDTKVTWFNGGNGTLTKDNISKSVEESLERLGVEKINILYAMGPDRITPLEEQAAAFDAVYRQGKFNKLGICNFPPGMFQQYIEIAESKGYVKPSVYQGQCMADLTVVNNVLCRTYETTLFPLLRKHNIAFNAFSPLAQGMLTGKLTFAQDQDRDLKGTRFDTAENNTYGIAVRHWYDKPSFHNAMRMMKNVCGIYGFSTTDAAMRWLVNHSFLDGSKGDGIIVGPRTMKQCHVYIQDVKDGPLPEDLVDALEDLWEGISDDAVSVVEY
ncbi:Aldo/keto reductase [Xylaria sp. CBS 124048]|nr:Aldo/keto reductase [Xylaria sp. CBS 124048]